MNKKYIWFVAFLLMLTSAVAQVQNLTTYEYWFDGDYSTVQTTTIGATVTLDLNEDVDVSGLDYGLHYITYRFKDERGKWSVTQSKFFSYYESTGNAPELKELTTYEYWFDGDYSTVLTTGVGATATLTLNEDIDVSGLDYGLHYITYRFKDERGKWSVPQSKFFSYYESTGNAPEMKELIAYEYWIDGDYSTVHTTGIGTTATLTLNEDVDVSGLEYGLHYITYRFKDERGKWSVTQSKFFSYYESTGNAPELKELIAYEYWIDGDYSTVLTTGVGATATLTLNEDIDTSGLDYGLHYITYRFKDERGKWSVPQSEFFGYYENNGNTPELKELTTYEYWIDGDYSTVQTTVIGATATLTLDENVDISGLEYGLHYITYRFKDERGIWSVPQTEPFSYYEDGEILSEPLNITAYRYWVDTDLNTLVTTDVASPSAYYTLDESVDLPTNITGGQHSITFQFKDDYDDWSIPQSDNFFIDYDPRGSITAVQPTVCHGSEVTLTSDVIDVNTIVWDFGDGSATVSSTTSETPMHSYTDPGDYTVTAVFIHNDTGYTNSATIQVTSLALDNNVSITGNNPVCYGSSIILTANETDNVTYLWSNGETTQSIEVTESGKYSVVITSTLNTDCSTTSEEISISVNNPINIDVSLEGITLTAQEVDCDYQWIDCEDDSDISGATEQTYTPEKNGSYKVRIIKDGCEVISDCHAVTSLNVDDEFIKSKINLYPNPVSDILYIDSSIEGQLELFDTLGRMILEKTITRQVNSLETNKLQSGVYFVRIFAEDENNKIKSGTFRVIIE